MQIPGTDYWKVQIECWRYYALVMRAVTGNGPADETQVILLDGTQALKQLLPPESVSPLPDVLLHYLHYSLLKNVNAGEVDKNTALSITFKRLQQRASRIDDLELKRHFTSHHYWNSKLFAAARENRLI
jgi:hypothetical protein